MTMVQKCDADDPDRRWGLVFTSARTWKTVEGRVLRDSERRSVCAIADSLVCCIGLSSFEETRSKGYNILWRVGGAVSTLKIAGIQKRNALVLVIKFKGASVLALEVFIVLCLKIHEW